MTAENFFPLRSSMKFSHFFFFCFVLRASLWTGRAHKKKRADVLRRNCRRTPRNWSWPASLCTVIGPTPFPFYGGAAPPRHRQHRRETRRRDAQPKFRRSERASSRCVPVGLSAWGWRSVCGIRRDGRDGLPGRVLVLWAGCLLFAVCPFGRDGLPLAWQQRPLLVRGAEEYWSSAARLYLLREYAVCGCCRDGHGHREKGEMSCIPGVLHCAIVGLWCMYVSCFFLECYCGVEWRGNCTCLLEWRRVTRCNAWVDALQMGLWSSA